MKLSYKVIKINSCPDADFAGMYGLNDLDCVKGMIDYVKLSYKVIKINSCPDADFAGMYGLTAMDDLDCVKGMIDYVIMAANVASQVTI